MPRRAFLVFAFALVAAAPQPASIGGLWDLSWANRHGTARSGWMVVRQQGTHIIIEVHGRREVTASGTHFVLHGSQYLIPFTIEGRVEGDRIEGVLKAVTLQRRFTARRRRG
jgi:hypothetical protein